MFNVIVRSGFICVWVEKWYTQHTEGTHTELLHQAHGTRTKEYAWELWCRNLILIFFFKCIYSGTHTHTYVYDVRWARFARGRASVAINVNCRKWNIFIHSTNTGASAFIMCMQHTGTILLHTCVYTFMCDFVQNYCNTLQCMYNIYVYMNGEYVRRRLGRCYMVHRILLVAGIRLDSLL